VKGLFILLFILFLYREGATQNDSTLILLPERLGEKDIVVRSSMMQKTRALSATRAPEPIDGLPFTIYVVTAEDILRNGFVTLGDVLHAAPGIRVSKTGHALEGETFLMRGMSGNQYVEILINDVPIKPGTALGMPIGAQLPVRQAERIEIFYGAAAALYGNEACAGVVNIILKETERPVYTQADLSFGNNGYNSLDIMFGGKLGKDKDILRYSIYGSNTIREKTDVFYDASLFNTKNYLPFGLDSSIYTRLANYRPVEDDVNTAQTAPIPHESRLLGFNLAWRGLQFSYNRMTRFEHSALGLNPLAVSWSNPSNLFQERMESFVLSLKRQRNKKLIYSTLSFLQYKIANTSTTTHIFDRLSAVDYLLELPFINTEQERLTQLQESYQIFASRERYNVANGADARFETRFSTNMGKRWYLQTGVQANLSVGTPPLGHYTLPIEVNLAGSFGTGRVRPFDPVFKSDLDGNGFAQLEYTGGRIYAILGGAVNYSFNYGLLPVPRAALLYRIDSSWSLRANASGGFRRPSLYARSASYFYSANDFVQAGAEGFEKSETTYSGELGIRYARGKLFSEALLFYQRADNLIRNGDLRQEPGIVPTSRYGFANAPGRALSHWGIQGLFRSQSFQVQAVAGKKKYRLSSRNEFFIQYARGREWFGDDKRLFEEVLNMPKWITQFRTIFSINKLQFMLSSNRQTSVLRKSVVYRDRFQLPKQPSERNPTFRTWDMTARIYLSNYFSLYFVGQNIFNRHVSGLDATGTPDDLLYNPQQRRLFRLGASYNMN
jgi:outer membrane receptor protein involved in Fe transport